MSEQQPPAESNDASASGQPEETNSAASTGDAADANATAPVAGWSQATSPVPGPAAFGTEVNETAVIQEPAQPAEQPYQNPYYATAQPDQTYAQPAYAPVPVDPYAAYSGGGYQPPPPTKTGGFLSKSDPNSVLWKAVIAGVLAGLLAGILAGFVGFAVANGTIGSTGVSTAEQENPSNPNALSPRADNSIAAISKAMLPTVASITVKAGQGGDTGSGVSFSQGGYILTNNHVVAAAANGGTIAVKFQGGDAQPATIVGRSPAYDLAVIKTGSDHPVAKLGNSGSVAVGDAAIAIGSPLGLDGTVTSGIISAVNRPVTAGGQGEASFINALQTDAPINPGNSGGPLVNSESQVIGINSAIATLGGSSTEGGSQSGSIGLGFAIPINTAKRIADEIIATGKSTTPIIGVGIDQSYSGPGAKIKTVTPGGPAAKAGLQPGDIIVAVNGQKDPSAVEVLTAIRSLKPGDTITLTVQTPSGGTKDVKLTLGGTTS